MTYNVRDFGAVGDGVHLDSPAVQAAADACRENGGGTIYFPAGNYLCASMRLYDNTCVRIEAGATVLACTDEQAYSKPRGKYDEFFTRDAKTLMGDRIPSLNDTDFTLDWMPRCFLQCFRNRTDNIFCAINAKNVTVMGEGTIDGRQMEFFYPEVFGEDMSLPRWMRHPEEISYMLPHMFRPQMMVFYGCENIKISGLKMLRSPFFNIRILDTVDAHVDHLFISGDPRCINSDGINIAGSKNVFVDSCCITCGDDCIAISTGEVQPRAGDCENIVVSNCVLNTGSNMARIFCGIDLDPTEAIGVVHPKGARDIARGQKVRNVSISNCIMLGGSTAINVNASYGTIENVRVSGLITKHTHRSPAVFIGAIGEGEIRDVSIDGLRAAAHSGINIIGYDKGGRASVENVSVSNSHITVSPTASVFGLGMPDKMNDYWALEYGPYNINMRHVDNVDMSNVTVKWGEEDLDDLNEVSPAYLSEFYKAQWRPDMEPTLDWPAVYGYDCKNVSLRAMKIVPHGESDVTVFENCTNVNIAKT